MSNIHYTTLPQANQYSYHQQPINHYHHYQQQQQQIPTQLVSPTGTVSNISTYSNNYSSQTQSSAYFLDRFDLDNYTTQTLKQIVENILSKNKSKGLKVKLSLPDDGLIIDNQTDANQSWIFKTSELLYFWRDPLYPNIIAVVTKNRSRNNRPYSASVFRLRANESAQNFLQQAQKFFSNLPTVKSFRAQSSDKLLRNDTLTKHQYESKSSMKTKSLTKVNKPPETTNIRRVTRAEFDPGKTPVSTNQRTQSETASSIDSTRDIISYTKRTTHDDEDKLTTVSNAMSLDQVAELMRELKNLRNEITALKLERKLPISTRTISTSPLVVYSDKVKQTNDSSTTTSSPSFLQMLSDTEKDAETQTDFSLVSHQRKQITRKNKKTMIGTSGISSTSKNQISTTTYRKGQRTVSNSSTTTISDQEDSSSEISSQTTQPSTSEHFQPTILSAPPRPIVIQNSISHEEDLVTIDKEIPTFLSSVKPSSNIPPTNENTHFQSSNENIKPSTEHIYENVPILIQSNTTREAIYTIPIIKSDESKSVPSDDHVYYTINNSIESQQNSSNSPPTMDNSSSMNIQQQQKPQIVSAGRHRNQPIYFANHLTNPMFNIDKQLLINTIANQFGIDLNSPQLQQLITNQHLFVARKRTFANMIWQMTPDEETALYSSIGNANQILIDSNESNNSSARSILKLTKNLPSKRRSITWDNTLE